LPNASEDKSGNKVVGVLREEVCCLASGF